MSETIEAQVIPQTQALAIREPQQMGLFGTSDPVAVIDKAASVANALKSVLVKQGLISKIQNKEYPKVEAWTLLGTMLGVFPVTVWTKEINGGWEARVEARTKDGSIVGAAEAQCMRTERNWEKRDDFALRSMAQTRATAKCLRMPLGFVMTLAGFEATPAEEMATDHPRENAPRRTSLTVNKVEHHQPDTEADKAAKPGLLGELRKLCGQFEPSLVRYLQNEKTPTGVILLMPNEDLEDLKVPVLRALIRKWDESYPKIEEWARRNPVPVDPSPANESWRGVIVSIPRKAMKREQYMKRPDTIGSLYDASHTDEESRKRLWGLCEHFEVETTWVNKEGKTVHRSEGQINDDRRLREGLDAFLDWMDGQQEQAGEQELPRVDEDTSVPF